MFCTLPRFAPFALMVALSAGCRVPEQVQPTPAGAAAGRILGDVRALSSDLMEGRGTGTAGNNRAAAYIARRHHELGVMPLIVDTARTECRAAPAPADCLTYLQHFVARSAEMAHQGQPGGLRTQNVVALIPGSDRALRGEYIVIGAHFDHLGRSPAHSSDPQAGNVIRNGADDNASGTAGIMELARAFAAQPARRSIIVASFSGEELGLLGSQWFVEHAPVPLGSVAAMVNFDMIGRLRNDKLIVYGVATAAELPAILDDANVAPKLALSTVGDGFGPSDHSSFYTKGIPVLHFFTDLHADYHTANDDAHLVNAAGAARVVELAERVVRAIADRPTRLTPVRTVAPVASAGSRQGSNTFLGSVPDMSAGEIPGLKLSGVREGSPADLGGLEAGDVIVELGGAPVKDLYGYTDALYAHKPGDVVKIVYLRGGERRSTSVTLGKRGQ